MKKIFVTLLLAVTSLALTVGCNNTADKSAANGTSDETTQTENGDKLAVGGIVFINSDSLISGYTLYKELKATFDEKAKKKQGDLETRGKSLERKIADFQNKIEKGLMTRAEAAELQQTLEAEQNSLMQYRDQVLAELSEEEQVMFNNINNDINEYIKTYNETKNYDLILNTNRMSNTVMLGNPKLDITNEVLVGLNQQYASKTSK